MSTIVLHGDLQKFGGPFNFDVASPADAIRALCAQLKGFRRRLAEGQFRVVRKSMAGERDLYLEAITSRLRPSHELHIVPVVAGSGGGGSGKAMIGIAIIAAAFTFGAGAFIAAGDFALAGTAMSATAFSVAGFSVSFASIAGFGAAMLLGGVASMLSPTPRTQTPGSSVGQDTNSSFTFNGPVNVTQQGSAVPLAYGRFTCGSVVISSALTAEQI
jgi:predicted phage tail protein